MNVVIGIDIGGSTTKIVGFVYKNGWELIEPDLITANDPVTATYGAFGKFIAENGLRLSDISKVVMTGVGASHIKQGLYELDCRRVPEFDCIGRGGLYTSGLSEALIVSMGTGTAMVHASESKGMKYLGGTGVGGGTLMGLSKLLLGTGSVENVEKYAEHGSLEEIDLRIKDLTGQSAMGRLESDLTASNFGKVSDSAGKDDIASGIINMVLETVGMISIFAARSVNVSSIVLTGNVTQLREAQAKFDEFSRLEVGKGLNFTIPKYSRFATAIGAAILGIEGGEA